MSAEEEQYSAWHEGLVPSEKVPGALATEEDTENVLFDTHHEDNPLMQWQYKLRERFLLTLERAQDALVRGDVEAARSFVDRGLDMENFDTDDLIFEFTVDEEEVEPAFGVVTEDEA